MNVLRDVAKELFAMFVADGRLTLMVLLLVAATAFLAGSHFSPLISGGCLLLGAIAILTERVRSVAARASLG